jgi:ADP-ribose pyrophosphatase YjhB (NUDIX family)
MSLEVPTRHAISGLDLKSMTNLQVIQPVIDAYKDAEYCSRADLLINLKNVKYYDAPVLEKNSISSTVDTDNMSAEEIVASFDTKKWADVSVYRTNGELRKDLVELYNARTFKTAKERYGIELVDTDPTTGLFINPLMKGDNGMEMVYGRGILGKYGINDAVDLRVFTTDPEGIRRVLTIRRPRDINQPLATPGGVIDYKTFHVQEEPKDAATREGFEEVGLKLPEGVKINVGRSVLVADSRNTILSMMGTTICDAEVTWEQALKILEDWKKFKAEEQGKSAADIEADGVEFRAISGPESILRNRDSATRLPFFAAHEQIISEPESIKNLN